MKHFIYTNVLLITYEPLLPQKDTKNQINIFKNYQTRKCHDIVKSKNSKDLNDRLNFIYRIQETKGKFTSSLTVFLHQNVPNIVEIL